MYKYLSIYVVIIAIVYSYIEVNNKFYSTLENGEQCSPNSDLLNNNNLYSYREKFVQLCNASQNDFENEVNEMLKNITRKETYINDLFDVTSVHKYELLGCFDLSRMNYVKNEMENKVIRLLNDENDLFKYSYYFIKAVNTFLNFIFLTVGLIMITIGYGINYFLLETIQFVSSPIGKITMW